MRYPEFLKENGTVRLVAPSFGAGFEPYISMQESAVKQFEERGVKVSLGPNCRSNCGIGISNTPQKCGEELTESYVNPEYDVLLSVGGGELMCETLSELDVDAIDNAKPKWFMGYSDNTNFTFLLATRFDVASIYGPSSGTFGMRPWHQYLKDAWEVLCGRKLSVSNYDYFEVESLKSEENPLAPLNPTEPSCIKAFVPATGKGCGSANSGGSGDVVTGCSVGGSTSGDYDGTSERNVSVWQRDWDILTDGVMSTNDIEMEGRLIGGCLDILDVLVGTRFDYVNQFIGKYREEGFIWYLEACDLNVFEIRRALWTMQEAGWLRHVKGFIFGRPMTGIQPMMNLNHFDAVLPTACVKNQAPVILDADIGHVAPSMPIINGAYAKVRFKNGSLKIDYELK